MEPKIALYAPTGRAKRDAWLTRMKILPDRIQPPYHLKDDVTGLSSSVVGTTTNRIPGHPPDANSSPAGRDYYELF